MKEKIRDNLSMIYDNLDNFNEYSLQWIDKKALRKFISIWRWYISHGYFNEKHPQPKGISSNPPLPWLHSQLEGLSVPLHRDIAECIMPKVQSSLKTEQAARRIMNRMNMIYGYVTPEAALADQQAHRDKQDKKIRDRIRAQKARVDRKAERDLAHQELIEKEQPRLRKKFLKEKTKQRNTERDHRLAAAEEARRIGRMNQERMKEAMRERRK